MGLSCFTLFVPIQLHNHIMVWTGRRDATVMCSMGLVSPWPVPPGCCSDSLDMGAAWLCPPDHPVVSLRLVLALVGFHHCLADFELLEAVFVHLPLGQEEEDDAGRQSNGPAGQPAVKELERVGGEARVLCHAGAA